MERAERAGFTTTIAGVIFGVAGRATIRA